MSLFEFSQGHYCPEGSPLALPCPTGEYQPNPGSPSCIPCRPGFYCEEAVVGEPRPCPPHSFCPAGSVIRWTEDVILKWKNLNIHWCNLECISFDRNHGARALPQWNVHFPKPRRPAGREGVFALPSGELLQVLHDHCSLTDVHGKEYIRSLQVQEAALELDADKNTHNPRIMQT